MSTKQLIQLLCLSNPSLWASARRLSTRARLSLCSVMSPRRETDIKWDNASKWVWVLNRGTLIKVTQERKDENDRREKKNIGWADRRREAGLSHTAPRSLATLPETSVQSSHTQLCDDVCVYAMVQLCIPIRGLTLSPPLRDPPTPQSSSFHPLIPSAVPPSGPVTATGHCVYVCMCVFVCVTSLLRKKHKMVFATYNINPEVQPIKQAFY